MNEDSSCKTECLVRKGFVHDGLVSASQTVYGSLDSMYEKAAMLPLNRTPFNELMRIAQMTPEFGIPTAISAKCILRQDGEERGERKSTTVGRRDVKDG